MVSELHEMARRLEQQIAAFEKMHVDEMKRFQEQFEVYRQLQNDELEMLRRELARLKDDLAQYQAADSPAETTPPVVPSPHVALEMTRRDFITGPLRPLNPRRL